MNALSILRSGRDTNMKCVSLQISGKKFPRKIVNAKVRGTG